MKYNIKDILNGFFSQEKQSDSNNIDQDKIATAVLFIELAYADFEVAKEEEDQIKSSLMKFFELNEDEYLELLETAKTKRDERNDIWLFTQHVKDNYSRERKLKIMDMLWQLVYADNHMDKYEEALMRKITNLLGLTHGEMIEAKLKAKG